MIKVASLLYLLMNALCLEAESLCMIQIGALDDLLLLVNLLIPSSCLHKSSLPCLGQDLIL